MASRGSQHDIDELTWATTAVRLGTTGLDLREPSEPTSLTKLLNARFEDDRTIARRFGHTGRRIRDSAEFPPLGNTYRVSGDWVYGHGATVSSANAVSWENAHHPFPNKAEATFNFDGADVVWTGDRLLVTRDAGTAIGASGFWDRSSTPSALKYGHPAYLPLQVDSTPPSTFRGEYLETALTSRYRLHAHNNAHVSPDLTAQLVDRTTGAVIDTSDISGSSGNVVEVVAINSGDVPTVLWRDFSTKILYSNHWTGVAWAGASIVHNDVYAFDVVTVSGGYYIVWREGTPSSAALKIGYVSGSEAQDTPFPFGSDLGLAATGAVSIDVAPDGELGVLAVDTGLRFRVLTANLVPMIDWTLVEAQTVFAGGISLRARGLRNENGEYPWVIHTSRGSALGVLLYEATITAGVATFESDHRYNSVLASKSFRVGDEVFCWLRAGNAGTHYLVAGALQPQVCGYADREEALTRIDHDGNYAIPHVWPDSPDVIPSALSVLPVLSTGSITPLAVERSTNYLFTWARPYNTGQDYPRGGNVRVGDMNFLPDISATKFGRSVYLSGSAVRNWDGVQLGDAGFQDYPVISAVNGLSGGALTEGGTYYWRVYLVRYNARGERFMSAAVSFGPAVLAAGHHQVTLTINSVPDTNHDDCVIEVYRTEDLGSTFYLEGTVDNDLTAATVTFTSALSDEDLRSKLGDSHAAGVGQLSEIEEWGPLGCQMLAVSGDRLWGAGGQVPPGIIQFSKLKEDGEGAGFDDIAGFQTVDNEGRPVTLVQALNDTTVVHQRDRLFIVAGTGPDNYGRGAFTIPQIMLADGAVTMRGGCVNQLGHLYWGSDGPRLLTTSFQVHNISAPVRALTETMDPSGVRADLAGHQVVWYTREGTALLWNYLDGESRWAQWSGLQVTGCSDNCLAVTDGRLLYPDESTSSDDGQSYAFVWSTGRLRAEEVLAGYTLLRSIGLTGAFNGPHRLRFRVYYNGSPLWTDQWIWEPETQTWLTTADAAKGLSPGEVDSAYGTRDHSGAYVTHRRPSRENCTHFRVEVSDIESDGETYTPFELALELGSRGGLGRVPVNTFTTKMGG